MKNVKYPRRIRTWSDTRAQDRSGAAAAALNQHYFYPSANDLNWPKKITMHISFFVINNKEHNNNVYVHLFCSLKQQLLFGAVQEMGKIEVDSFIIMM